MSRCLDLSIESTENGYVVRKTPYDNCVPMRGADTWVARTHAELIEILNTLTAELEPRHKGKILNTLTAGLEPRHEG